MLGSWSCIFQNMLCMADAAADASSDRWKIHSTAITLNMLNFTNQYQWISKLVWGRISEWGSTCSEHSLTFIKTRPKPFDLENHSFLIQLLKFYSVLNYPERFKSQMGSGIVERRRVFEESVTKNSINQFVLFSLSIQHVLSLRKWFTAFFLQGKHKSLAQIFYLRQRLLIGEAEIWRSHRCFPETENSNP